MEHPSRASDRKLKLSALQEAILHWLRRQQRRQPQAANGGVPYPDLAHAFGVDRAELSACVRRLIRKRLVVSTLPRGSWVRYIALTDKGEADPRQVAPKERKKARGAAEPWELEPRRSRRKGKTRRRGRRTPLPEMDA